MPLFIRKSFSIGPFRFNLSKSGAGVSFGVKGLRVGEKPSGDRYVTGGRGGVYFRESLGKAAAPRAPAPATILDASSPKRELLSDPLADEATRLVAQGKIVFESKRDLISFLRQHLPGPGSDGQMGFSRAWKLADLLTSRAEHAGPEDPLRVRLAAILEMEAEIVASGHEVDIPLEARMKSLSILATVEDPNVSETARAALRAVSAKVGTGSPASRPSLWARFVAALRGRS